MDINSKINFIDHIVYINMERSVERRLCMEKLLEPLRVPSTRIYAIDGDTYTYWNKVQNLFHSGPLSKHEIACTLSHVKAINYLSGMEGDYFLVLEDDASFDNCLIMNNCLKDIITKAPKFDILQLYKTYYDKLPSEYVKWIDFYLPNNLNKVIGLYGTVGYIISRSGINNLCDIIKYDFVNDTFVTKVNHEFEPADAYLYKNVNTVTYKYNFIGTTNIDSTFHDFQLEEHKKSQDFQLKEIYKFLSFEETYIPKIYFITFGNTSTYFDAVKRICFQASKFNMFYRIIGYDEDDLKNDKEFWDKHKNFIETNKRGYGYWMWKPYLIKRTLNIMNENDILLYADSGCELNIRGKQKLVEQVENVKTKLLICTSTGHLEHLYTKQDLIDHFYMNDDKYLQSEQSQATIVMMVKCEKISKLYDEIYKTSEIYDLINDVSHSPNKNTFIDHRHDQSIFSLLTKKYNLVNYDLDPVYTDNFYDYNKIVSSNLVCAPIWAARNRTGNINMFTN